MTSERAWVTGWMLCAVLLCGAVAAVIATSAGSAGELSDLQTIADLAALAGTDGGRSSAAAIARENGADLADFRSLDADSVRVEVERAGAAATATATRAPIRNSPVGSTDP